MSGRLDGKATIVTGAASGQGRVASEIFGREGARLILADIDAEGVEETAERVRRAGGEATTFVGDLTQEPSNQEMVDLAVARLGRLDVIYNAAGLVRFGSLHETSLEDWRFVLDHELTLVFLACKWALRAMLEAGSGCIINISSGSGLYSGTPRHAAHAATKAAIVGLTRQIAVEYGPKGIRCNAIAPGFLQYAPGQRRVASQTRGLTPEGIPLGRFTRPEDTAHCALQLASDDASFITGQIILVDGGSQAR
jgi:NAD(P)-dependent dehydrogenase (short-subunit alcohol dehydrogenase family)